MTFRTLFLILVATATVGCSTVKVHPAKPADKPKGARVYPPKIYLMVGSQSSELVTLPDLCRPYDLKPLTILAKQDFKVDVQEGQLKALSANQDTTAILTFLQGAARMAAEMAGAGVSSKKLSSGFGLPQGIYEFKDDGRIAKIDPNGTQTPCPGWAE